MPKTEHSDSQEAADDLHQHPALGQLVRLLARRTAQEVVRMSTQQEDRDDKEQDSDRD